MANTSGVISGLRGTGKTHLMLLARHEINENCFTGKANGVFCVYLNVKRQLSIIRQYMIYIRAKKRYSL